MGAWARQLGRGGIALVAAAAGVSVDTVSRGAGECDAGVMADGRVRAKGAVRRPVGATDPGVWPGLEKLVDLETRGDPMSAVRWTTKSTAHPSETLTTAGHQVSPETVARVLKDHGYRLHANAKTLEGEKHPDRDAQSATSTNR